MGTWSPYGKGLPEGESVMALAAVGSELLAGTTDGTVFCLGPGCRGR